MCGFDGNTSAISAIKDGTLGMDIAQLGYDMGYKAVEAAVKALEGAQDEGPVRCSGSLLARRISTKSIHRLWILLRLHIIL